MVLLFDSLGFLRLGGTRCFRVASVRLERIRERKGTEEKTLHSLRDRRNERDEPKSKKVARTSSFRRKGRARVRTERAGGVSGAKRKEGRKNITDGGGKREKKIDF